MASEPKGLIWVPVWVDDGVVKALVLDSGALPVSEQDRFYVVQAQLHGERAGGWLAIRSTSDNQLMVYLAGQAGDVNVKQDTPSDMQVGLHGYDGSAWKKQGIAWSYYDRYAEQKAEYSATLGTNHLSLTAVPEGEVWTVRSIVIFTTISVISSIDLYVKFPAHDHFLSRTLTPAINTLIFWEGEVVLKKDDYIRATFYGCTIGDDLYMTAYGHKLKVDM